MMRPIVVAGDWNAPPHDRHRWRPRWLAQVAGLTITSAGPGTFGDIDYPMADTKLDHARRLPRRGSDHQPVVFRVAAPSGRVPLMVGTWNLLAHRDPDAVAVDVLVVFAAARLDVLLVQECSDAYAAACRAAGLVVVGGGQQRVILQRGVGHCWARHHRLSTRGWPLAPGRWHDPATATSVLVAGWLRVVSVHLPNHERGRWHALAYAQATRRLARYINRRR